MLKILRIPSHSHFLAAKHMMDLGQQPVALPFITRRKVKRLYTARAGCASILARCLRRQMRAF
jgi:hypothetical protein